MVEEEAAGGKPKLTMVELRRGTASDIEIVPHSNMDIIFVEEGERPKYDVIIPKNGSSMSGQNSLSLTEERAKSVMVDGYEFGSYVDPEEAKGLLG